MNTAIALGMFDGVHKAHYEVIKTALDYAESHALKCIVYTFDTHPQKLLGGNIEIITPNDIKTEILHGIGAENIHFEHVTKEFLSISPEQFIKMLANKFGVKFICAGYNYRFGSMCLGNAQTLIDLGRKYEFKTVIKDKITIEGKEISSSRIRSLLSSGEIQTANKLLIRPYTIRGTVLHGKGLGRQLGFPTANIAFQCDTVIPKYAVYESRTILDGKEYKSITNIGINPTLENCPARAETHILDFCGDLYGKVIDVVLSRMIREEMKFENTDMLLKSIRQDIEKVI